MPGAPSSVLAPSSMYGQEPLVASLLLVVWPGAPSSVLLFLVAMPGAPSSVLAPSSMARSP